MCTAVTHHLDYVGYMRTLDDQLPPHFDGYPHCRVRPLDPTLKDPTNLRSPPGPQTTPAVTTAFVMTVSATAMAQGIQD